MMPNHEHSTPDEPLPHPGLDAAPDEIEALVAPPKSGEVDDGPIVVMAPRPWSPPAALWPAVLLLLLAVGLMAYRAVAVEDWQGLFTEGRQSLLARAGWSDTVAAIDRPAPEAPKAAPAEPGNSTESPEGPTTDLAAVEGPTDPDDPAPATPAEPSDEATVAEAVPPADPAAAALEDIQQEAERRRAEQEELARLKEKIAAEAPPPRRGGPGLDQRQMLALIEQMKRRQLEMMDRALQEMERQAPGWGAPAWGGGDQAFGFGAIPPLPGFDGFGDDDAGEPFGFGDLRRRHAEAIERAERDMARFREQMARPAPFNRQPLAGAFPPPAPGLDLDADGALPPGLVVPEGAEIRTFNGPGGSRGVIMRWGWPPQPGGGR